MSHPTNFRVWSKQSSKWMNNIVLSAQGTPILMYSEKIDDRVFHRVFLIDNYEPVVQMSTGLKDKNGVEIYEGDIVSIDQNDSSSVEGAIIWYITAQWLVEHDDSLPAPMLVQSKTTVIDTVVERAARAALESAATAAEKAAEPQIVT